MGIDGFIVIAAKHGFILSPALLHDVWSVIQLHANKASKRTCFTLVCVGETGIKVFMIEASKGLQ